MIDIPPNSEMYLPVLVEEQLKNWWSAPLPHTVAGQIEQETCITLRHSRCWSPRAELKTSREYGFGLGQITVTDRFNNFNEFKRLSPRLRSWDWGDRYNPEYQILSLVLVNKSNYERLRPLSLDSFNGLSFSYAAYNGGLSGVLRDRKMCESVEGCDPRVWFNNVSEHSFRAKTSVKGYSKSFFEINREYVYNIMYVRSEKYKLRYNSLKDVLEYKVFFGDSCHSCP